MTSPYASVPACLQVTVSLRHGHVFIALPEDDIQHIPIRSVMFARMSFRAVRVQKEDVEAALQPVVAIHKLASLVFRDVIVDGEGRHDAAVSELVRDYCD